MPGVPVVDRFRKLIDDISRLYVDAHRAQVRGRLPSGANGTAHRRRRTERAMRAAYGSALIPRLSKVLSGKYGAGFSENVLRKMRQFYLLNPIQPISVELDWSDYVELLPVKDAKTRKRLERCVS